MALAETPDSVNARRKADLERQAREREDTSQVATADPETDPETDPFHPSHLSEGLRQGVVKHGEARDGSHPMMRQLRMTMRGWNTSGYVQVLKVLEVVCPTDRAYERARKQVLDIMNDQERAMLEIINRLVTIPKAREKGKDSNGEG